MPETLHILVNGDSVAAEPGDTILSAQRRAGRQVQHVCGGRGMCGTCRVAIDEDWVDRLPPPAFSETRLLRVLKAGAPNHRLACQVILASAHDGLVLVQDPPPLRRLPTQPKETVS